MMTLMMQSEIDAVAPLQPPRCFGIDQHLPVAVWQTPPDLFEGNSAAIEARHSSVISISGNYFR
jgi:hypothetical protein